MRVLSDIDEVLTTTRTVRFRLDLGRPVASDVLEECLGLAQQATMGSNVEEWRIVIVLDAAVKLAIAELYRDTYEVLVARPLRELDPDVTQRLNPTERGEGIQRRRQQRVMDGVKYLADNLEHVPALVFFATVTPVPTAPVGKLASGFYGSIFPMIWSFQLALRSRGLGSVLATGAMHHSSEIASLLELPPSFTPISMVPVAYTKGVDFRAAARLPLSEILRYDRWSQEP